MRNRKVFTSILVSYIVITLTPMIILGVIIFNFFYGFYYKESLNSRADTINRMRITVDARISEMNANAYIIFNSPEFSVAHLKQEYGNFYDVNRKLSNIVFTNSFISDIFYLNDELQKFFTSETMYTYQNFENQNLDYIVPGFGDYKSSIDNQSSYWLPTQNKNRNQGEVLAYVVSDKIGREISHSSVVFQIQADTLRKLTGEFVAGTESCVIMCDDADNLLYTSNREISNFAWPVWQKYPDKRAGEPIKMEINGETYVIYANNSMASSIKYISIIPYQSITAPIRNYNFLFFAGVFVITVVCSLFIFYFMRINYTPIRAISKLAASFFGEPQKDMGEFETTEYVLHKITEYNSSLLCDKITLKLMRGGFDNLEDFDKESRRIGYKLTGPLFRVIGFNVSRQNLKDNTPMNLNRYRELSIFIENTMKVYVDACAVEYSEAETIYVVASGQDEELDELENLLHQIKNVIESAFGISVSIGVGNVTRINEVMDSSSQATIANKYQLMKGRGNIVFYKNIANKSAVKAVYPNQAVDALYHAILLGEEERVQFAMGTLITYISESNSLFFGTCLAYDIMNVTMKAMRELNYSFSTLNQSDLVKKGTLDSIDEIVQIVNMISNEIVDFISAKGVQPDEAVVLSTYEQVVNHIAAHYKEENFSVKVLADHFGMSISNFSHYFKKQTGQTVSDYISLLRINKAKELLRTTDMNLQDISVMCGYIHLSTFMRQFKRHDDMTPSTYRSRLRH